MTEPQLEQLIASNEDNAKRIEHALHHVVKSLDRIFAVLMTAPGSEPGEKYTDTWTWYSDKEKHYKD